MNYYELPSRGKVTAEGIKTKNHACGGRCYVFYDEDMKYHVECEKCGTVAEFTARSLDGAILTWNYGMIG
jgi:Fe2+ or Zn2+ uptake regulation protein